MFILQSNELIASLDDLQDIDELYIEEVRAHISFAELHLDLRKNNCLELQRFRLKLSASHLDLRLGVT